MHAHGNGAAWRGRAARAGLAVIIMLGLSAYDWPQFGSDAQHSGNETRETLITAANVNTLARIYQVTLPGIADSAPIFLNDVLTVDGWKRLLFVTTKNGWIVALDWRTGGTVWSHQNGPGGCTDASAHQPCITTASPALDPTRQHVYSYGLDGYVHKYRASDGQETLTGGWPELATTKPGTEKGSSALSIAPMVNGVSYLYVANSGYIGDAGDYQGHITAINLSTGAQKVFNAVCSNQTVHFTLTTPDCPTVESAIWARGGVTYDPDTQRIYMATGNGTFSPTLHYWGDTLFALNPDGTGAGGNPLDSFTPTNFKYLQDNDVDLGSTGPVILPGTSKYPHLGLQGGKEGKLVLLNLDDLSGQGSVGHTGGELSSSVVTNTTDILPQPAVWTNPQDQATWIFVATEQDLHSFKLSVDGAGNPSLLAQWDISGRTSSPIVANNVLFFVQDNNAYAVDPVTKAQLWNANNIGSIHWESPIVADGAFYVTDQSSHFSAYTLGGIVPLSFTMTSLYLPLVLH